MTRTTQCKKAASMLTRFAICALATALLGYVPRGGAAQDTTLSGTWRHRGGETEQERRLEAIDNATEDMGFMIRGRARDRLREATAPQPEITIRDQGDEVTITTRAGSTTLSTDGSATRSAGEQEATVRARRRDGNLVVTARTDNGSRTSSYHLSEDGERLTLVVRVSNERLSAPLRFRVTYRRQS